MPARSVVVTCTVDGPSGSLALTVYLPEASASPLAFTVPLATVTVENGSVEPLKEAGDVLMRPSSAAPSSLSVGMLVSTVKRQSLRTWWRKRLELVATKETVCGPSARLPVVNVSLSPLRVEPAVMSLPSNVTRTPESFCRPCTSRITVRARSLT